MTTTLERPPAILAPGDGGMAARRAMTRWAWRLFRREWRQQLLILALVAVAVAATVVGATVSTDNLPPADSGFGTAHDMATLQGPGTTVQAQIASLERRFHNVDVIENQALTIPGSIQSYDLRAQNPDGAFGQPMLALVSGRYPSVPGQVALTQALASDFGVSVGDTWHAGGTARTVVGIVENPQSLLDEFALVIPGQVAHPTTTTVLFNAFGVNPGSIGDNVHAVGSNATANPINPDTIVLALATLTMLLIVLVAIGGFSVLAQRRLRSIGMLGALGATDRDVRSVVQANGLAVGVVGSLAGAAVGFVVWLIYRPHLESSSHHEIGTFDLPWGVIVAAVVLGVLATSIAASRPARTVARVPIVVALSGRPAPPKELHRTAMPGLIALLAGTLLMVISGSSLKGGGGGATLPLLLGFVALIVAVVLLAPFCVDALAKTARRAPIAVRLALRDLARYRARSGPALAAISLGVMIAVVISVVAAARYGNVLDYAGPNVASNQLILYATTGSHGNGPTGGTRPSTSNLAAETRAEQQIAASLGSRDVVTLKGVDAALTHIAPGRNWNGPLYVGTPQLLHAYGIDPASVPSSADIISMRPGLSSISEMALMVGGTTKGGVPPGEPQPPCARPSCVANPDIVENSALPSGTSAPNTVITQSAVRRFHLEETTTGWIIQTSSGLTAAQINEVRQAAASAGMSIETKNSQPTSSEVIGWATVFGVVLALGVLAMTVGLIRSETAADLRTLTATGASSGTRRVLSATTAGALGLLGALIGTAVAYLASAAWFRGNTLNGGLSALLNAPGVELLAILVGMPLAAAAVGWVLAGRQPSIISHQPME